jgi:hypothetical protein
MVNVALSVLHMSKAGRIYQYEILRPSAWMRQGLFFAVYGGFSAVYPDVVFLYEVCHDDLDD